MTVTMTLVGVTSHNLLLPKFQKEKKKKKHLSLYWWILTTVSVKIVDGGLYFISSFYFILFYFSFSFSFPIFRTARVRVDLSRCHISHELMAKSQDWSRDLGELSRRFKNKWHHTTWTLYVDLMDYTWLFRVGCTVESTDHL